MIRIPTILFAIAALGAAESVTYEVAMHDSDGPNSMRLTITDDGVIIGNQDDEEGRPQFRLPYIQALGADGSFVAEHKDKTGDDEPMRMRGKLHEGTLTVIVTRPKQPESTGSGRKVVTPKQELEEGRRKQAARDPRGAMVHFQRAVEQRPMDIVVSAPALSGLIGCYQMLMGDAALAATYPTTVGRWLTKLPPLDGSTVPAPESLQEELLWAPLLRPEQPLSWQVQVHEQVGTVVRRRRKNEAAAPALFPGGMIGVPEQVGGTNIIATAHVPGMQRRITADDREPMVEDTDDELPVQAELVIGQQRLPITGASISAWSGYLNINLDAGVLPPDIARIDRLEGVVRLRQPLAIDERVVALEKGVAWEVHGVQALVTSVDLDDEELALSVRLHDRATKDGQRSEVTAGDGDTTILIRNLDGTFAENHGSSTSTNGKVKRMILRYAHVQPQAQIVVRTVTAWSRRELPLRIENIELP